MISMKRIFCCLSLCAALQVNAQQRPNIIVFLVDDMGWQDTAEPFWTQATPLNKRYRTPHMQRLARQGMKFTNAYATPVCTPTRVSLMTGMNAARHQVTSWTNYQRDKRSDWPDSTLMPPDWNLNGLSPAPGILNTVYATPLPKLLAQAGYHTIHCGKAHYASSGTPGADPLTMGYAVNIAGHAAGHPASYLPEKQYGAASKTHGVPGLEEFYNTDVFLTEALTRKAIAAVEGNRASGKPFFLYMAHYAVHVPLQADKRFYQYYIGQGLSTEEAKYAGLLEGMDKSLGDLMDYLQREGMAENTVIIFMSDNGGLSLAPRTPPEHTQNLPLKAGKGSVHEGGIREPMIVSWPGVVKPGTVAAQPVIIEDFFPSILDMAGIRHAETVQRVDGQSFLPILENNTLEIKERLLVWHYPHRWKPGEGPGLHFYSAARKGRWKLIYDQRKQQLHLYDLGNDIGEEKDIALQHPEITRQLARELTQYLRERNITMPILKRTGRPVEWPDAL